jgi:hypothetical protein
MCGSGADGNGVTPPRRPPSPPRCDRDHAGREARRHIGDLVDRLERAAPAPARTRRADTSQLAWHIRSRCAPASDLPEHRAWIEPTPARASTPHRDAERRNQ